MHGYGYAPCLYFGKRKQIISNIGISMVFEVNKVNVVY
ncbi:hypothetical protein SAMN05192546_104155 [Tindallia californiensis]|uniref:Uncharacterized protein n=1 Tax=Tindallia californiensis TaxID=159292 RepID=A0A1H3MJ07_9FIRM|nr:hypothetical protein SAMN05192546_104155 [Tindallia californiensis]